MRISQSQTHTTWGRRAQQTTTWGRRARTTWGRRA